VIFVRALFLKKVDKLAANEVVYNCKRG